MAGHLSTPGAMPNGQPMSFAPTAALPRRRGVRLWQCSALLWAGAAPLIAVVVVVSVQQQVLSNAMALTLAAAFFAIVCVLTLIWAMQGLRQSIDESRIDVQVAELSQAMRRFSEHSILSDDARRLLNRASERELLVRAIEEDIAGEEWDAATVLCEELAERFGYRQEAEQYRSRIDQSRAATTERRVSDAIAQLDGLIVQRRWDPALREAARVRRLFPDSPRVENLRQRVEQARSVYKADLERRFLDSAQENRVEDAMDLLKELDGYLTETQAAPYREVARGVIGKARDNLGAQFKIAVQDRRWAHAAAIGRRIINEFPNTRMATEVREMMDRILSEANAPQPT
jgi:hypothetical protein